MRRLIKATAAVMLLCAGLATYAGTGTARAPKVHRNWVTFSDCTLQAHEIVGHQPNGLGFGALHCSSIHQTLQLYVATDVLGAQGVWYRKDYTARTYRCGGTSSCDLGNWLPDTNMTDSVNGHVYRSEVSGNADGAVRGYVSSGCTLGSGCQG